MILKPTARVRILSMGRYTIRLRSLHRAYPSLHPFGGSTLVTRAAEHKGCNWAFKLTDSCSLTRLCSATPSGIYATEIMSSQLHAAPLWLSWGTLNKCVVHLHLHFCPSSYAIELVAHSICKHLDEERSFLYDISRKHFAGKIMLNALFETQSFQFNSCLASDRIWSWVFNTSIFSDDTKQWLPLPHIQATLA